MKTSWQAMDLRQILRDGTLRLLLVSPVLILAVFGLGLPRLAAELHVRMGLDWTPYRPLVAGFAPLLCPMLMGFMAAFLLVDERDEGLLAYFRVTPLAAQGYLRHRLGMVWALGFAGSALALFLLWPGGMGLGRVMTIAAVIATQGPLFTLAIGALAANKMEALALGKLMGVLLLVPVIAYLVNSPLRYLAAPLPHFWAGAVFKTAALGHAPWAALALGALVHAAWLYLLVIRFRQRMD